MTPRETMRQVGDALGVAGLPGWASLAANMGAVGVLCWLVVVEMPAQRRDHAAELRSIETAAREEMRAIRDRDEIRTERLLTAVTENQRAIMELSASLKAIRTTAPSKPSKPGGSS